MSPVFIDTGAFYAREISADQHHRGALPGWQMLAESDCPLYSSELVLVECATLLARRSSYAHAASWVDDALSEPSIRWLAATRPEIAKAGALMNKFADQGVSFTDCVSFVLMKRENLRQAFAYDRHFVHAGFSLWGGDF